MPAQKHNSRTPKSRINPSIVAQSIPKKLSRGDKRKLAIVEATISIIASKGLQYLTFESIGKACGISKSHVAYHFSSIDLLISTSVAHAYSIGQGIVAEALKSEDRTSNYLKAYVHGSFFWIEKHPEHTSIAALLGYLATWNLEFKKTQTKIKTIGLERIIAILKAGKTHYETDIAILADAIQTLIMGKILYHSATLNKTDIKKLKVETWKTIEQILK